MRGLIRRQIRACGLTDLRECTVWVNGCARIDHDREFFN
jgi:hypothetical protein